MVCNKVTEERVGNTGRWHGLWTIHCGLPALPEKSAREYIGCIVEAKLVAASELCNRDMDVTYDPLQLSLRVAITRIKLTKGGFLQTYIEARREQGLVGATLWNDSKVCSPLVQKLSFLKKHVSLMEKPRDGIVFLPSGKHSPIQRGYPIMDVLAAQMSFPVLVSCFKHMCQNDTFSHLSIFHLFMFQVSPKFVPLQGGTAVGAVVSVLKSNLHDHHKWAPVFTRVRHQLVLVHRSAAHVSSCE